MAVMAGAFLFTACDTKEVDLGPAKLVVNPTDLSFESGLDTQEITLLATRDWVVTGLPDWIGLKESGPASPDNQALSLSVAENKGNNRSATIVFSIGFARQPIKVTQSGPEGEVDMGKGTKASPYTVQGVVAYMDELGADVTSPKNVFVKGKISSITEAFSTNFGNGTFIISDDGDVKGPQFTAYRVQYLGNQKYAASDTQIEVGDDVIIYGKVVNYRGNTPETAQGTAFLFSLNGVDKGGADDSGEEETDTPVEPAGTGTVDDPFNVAAAIAKAQEVGEAGTETEYYIKGKVKAISDQFGSNTYGNASFDMVDAGSSAVFKAFRVLYLGNKKWATGDLTLNVGDVVVICAKIVNFKGNTPENSGGYVYSIEGADTPGGGGEETPVEPAGTGTLDDPFNVAAAVAKAEETGETATEADFYVKGKVKEISDNFGNNTYGNATFTITDEGGSAVFTAYRVKYFDNQGWKEGDKTLNVGDEVVVCGKIVNFKGDKPEFAQNTGYVVSITAGGGDTPGGGDQPAEGDPGTVGNPFTVAQAIAKAVETGETATATEFYIKGKVKTISDNFGNNTFGNATFTIVDDGATDEFTAYRVKYFDNQGWKEGDKTLNEGDEVVLCSKIVNFKGNTPETSGGYVYSINGEGGSTTPGGGDQPGPSGEAGSVGNPFTVAQAIAKAVETGETATAAEYYTKGKVKTISDNFGNNTFGNATFTIVDDGATDEFTAYRVKYFENQGWKEGDKTLNEGDEVVLCSKIVNFKGNTPETSGGYVYSINGEGGSTTPGGDTPGGDTPGGDTNLGVMESNVTFSTTGGTNAYTNNTVNVTYSGKTYSSVANLRVGKTGEYGNATITVPAGTRSLSFFSVGWSNAPASIKFTAGNVEKTVDVAGNSGASGSGPYNMTVTDDDRYTISWDAAFSAATDIKFETYSGTKTGQRAYIFGVHACTTANGDTPSSGDTPGGDTPGGDTPGGDTPATPTHDGLTEANAFTVADAILTAKSANAGKEYYVKAVVGQEVKIKNGVATFELMDGTTDAVLTVSKAKSFGGAAWDGTEPIDWTDEVILKGKVTTLAGSLPAITDAVLIKWNGKSSWDGDEPAAHDGLTAQTAFTAAEAKAQAIANGPTAPDVYYYVTGIVVADATPSGTYGNVDFDINDGPNTESFKIFRLKGFDGAALAPENVFHAGDVVVVYGKLKNYNSNTPEMDSGGKLISINGKTSFDE